MWNEFFVAVAGAAAALTGLIFVGVSINLTRILSIEKLPDRAFQSLLILLSVTVVALLCLVPGQPIFYLGFEILLVGVVESIATLKLDLNILKRTSEKYKRLYMRNIAMTLLAVLAYVIAGVWILFWGASGLYWLVPGFIFSIIKSVSDAWVLLVEINR